jgi:hypothetical protein
MCQGIAHTAIGAVRSDAAAGSKLAFMSSRSVAGDRRIDKDAAGQRVVAAAAP